MNGNKVVLGILLGVAVVGAWTIVGMKALKGVDVSAKSMLSSAQKIGSSIPVLQVIKPDEVFVLPTPPAPPEKNVDAKNTPEISAVSALVVDPLTKSVLYEKDADQRVIMASLTKLISGITVADAYPFWAATSTLDNGSGIEGRRFFLEGDSVSLRDLLFGSLVGSSNRATYALADQIKPSSSASFPAKMRLKLQDLGLFRVQVGDAAGLSLDNKATAREIMMIYSKATERPIVKEALGTDAFSVEIDDGSSRLVKSTNALHDLIPHDFAKIGASKTGYLPESGFHFLTSVEDDQGHQLWVLVLGSTEHLSRFTEARDLAQWVFDNYTWK